MREFLKIFKRFIPPYNRHLILSIIYNLLGAVFTAVAMLFAIPILQVLFDTAKEVTALMPWHLSVESFKNNLYYYVTIVKVKYGISYVLPFIGILILFTTFLKVLFMYLASFEMVIIRNGIVRDIRRQIFDKLMYLPLSFFSDERKGDVMSRATGDVNEVENSIMSSIDMMFKSPITIIVLVGFMFSISFKLTIFVFVLLPITGWLIGRSGKSLKASSQKAQAKMGVLLNIIEESLGGLRIIKAFNAERKMKDRYNVESENYRTIMNRLQWRNQLAHPLSEFLGTVVIVIIIWFGAFLIGRGDSALDGATFLAYVGIFYQIIVPAKNFTTAFFSIQKGLAAMERIDKILQAKNHIIDNDGDKSVKHFHQHIEYKNVTFSYTDKVVLNNVSLSIPKGKMVALVGQSGSGKTTFVDLLPRFYDIQSGRICIDGVDIRHLKVHDLRGLMGNVNQEAILFNDTFFNNIAFGVESATEEEVIHAAKVANAHDFISATPDGYQTLIGDRGGKLSGGQRQRISIARAVLKNPDILILDEATSALDTESERLVQEALENLMSSRTSIVIAHRLSTVRNADLICVFQEGEIVETGTHQELMAQNGIYKKLHSLQMRE